MTEIDRLRAGEVTSTSLVERCLARIDAVDDRIRAFVTVTAERALEDAAAADAALAAGRPPGPLHGLPVGLKDNIDTAGVRTTSGSPHFLDHVPATDATVVRRLRAAGAVVVGKLTMHELAYGATSQNEHTGACRNPWDTNRVPGGSSGGSGAAVAADEVVAALGTDTGGSVRIPAALNGVAGLRGTWGLVPVTGILPLAPSLDTCGPLARHALDVARVTEAIAGDDPADPTCARRPAPDLVSGIDGGVTGVRVGVVRSATDAAEPEVAALVRAAADVLAGLGCRVEEVDVRGGARAYDAAVTLVRAEAHATHRERLATSPGLFGAEVLRRLRLSESVSGADLAAAIAEGRAWRRRVELLLDTVELLLLPTVGIPAPPADDPDMIETTRLLTQQTYGWSLCWLPAVSVPAGLTSTGLPVGLQLVAGPWQEALLLRAAHAYQQATDWHERRPPLA